MGVTGDTELGATKAEIIAAMVQKYLVSEAMLANTVTNVSQFAVKGAETISFPKKAGFSVENRVSGAAASTQALTFGKDTLTLSYRATVSWVIDSMDELESNVNVRQSYIETAAADHAIYLDNAIKAELESVAQTTTTAGDISKDIFLEMKQLLISKKAKRGNLYFAAGPDQETKLLSIADFIDASKFGSSEPIQNGVIGKVFGVKVIISPEIASGTFYMYEQSGLAYGFQRIPQYDSAPAPQYGAGSILEVLDAKFGVKGLQIAMQGAAAGKSALVVKDNN